MEVRGRDWMERGGKGWEDTKGWEEKGRDDKGWEWMGWLRRNGKSRGMVEKQREWMKRRGESWDQRD